MVCGEIYVEERSNLFMNFLSLGFSLNDMGIKTMKSYFGVLVVLMVMGSAPIFAQTSTTTSGTWNDATIWSSGVPGVTTTATVNNPTEINTNLSISTGAYTFNQSATDFAGGTEYSLTKNNTGSLTVNSGAVVNFNAACSITDGTITVNAGGTLIITAPSTTAGLSLPNNASLDFFIYGTLIIYGNVENKNNSGTFVVDGVMELRPIPGCGVCAGNFDNQTGSITVSGTGNVQASGSITNTGGSTTFGSNNDCATGPCSGQSLCLGNGVNVLASNQYICSGGSAAALTGDAVAGVTGYKWQSSTTSASSGFGGTLATTQNYNPGTPAQTTWYRRLVTTASCTDRPSLAVVITIIPSASWKGTTSTDWNVASNWCSDPTLPSISTNVVIPAGVPFQPTVSAATVALCQNLTISTGASVTINSTRQINVSGNVANNGTLSVSGVIQFNGSSAQTISGSGFSSWGTVIVNNSSGATPALTAPSAGLNVVTQLTLTAGKVNLSSANLTIGTAVGSTGTLSYSAGWLYGGNITRWIGAGALTLGNAPGHFPIGSTSDYRPAYFGSTSVTTGGTIRVNHTASSGPTDITDFSDGGTNVLIRSNSFWTIATGNSMPANTFDLRTEGTGFGTVINVSHLRLIQATSAIGTFGANGGTTTNPQVNRTGISTTNLNNNFYWGSTNLTTSLPVSVISFNGRQALNEIELDWATASELNFDYFEIERSANAKEFVSIGKVTGHGNSNVRNDYQMVDEKPLIGKNYYRLKSIDFDGYTEYFDIVAVDFSTTKSFFISPNPSDGTSLGFTLNFIPEANTSIIIYDNLSHVVGYYPPVSYSENITFTNTLKSGVYFAKFISGDFVKVERFVVR